MRSCRKNEEILARYLHGEVLLQEKEELEIHLAVCSSCENLYRQITDVDLALRHLEGKIEEPPPYLRSRILANLPESRSSAPVPAWGRWAALLGGALACAFLAIAAYRQISVTEPARVASAPKPSPVREAPAQQAAPAAPAARVAAVPKTAARVAETAPPVQVIREVKIYFYYPAAKKVAVTGDFNGWNAEGVPLRRAAKPGLWETDLRLKPGAYSYNFVVDGETLVPDPDASNQSPDGYGGTNSILLVKGDRPA